MGKIFWSTVALILLPLFSYAQSYKELWAQYEEASQKDLPRTEMQILEKIFKQAEKKQDCGQQLAAGLKWASLQTLLTPDSLEAEIAKLKKKQQEAESSNVVLSAVYATVLGKIYQYNSNLENGEQQSKIFFEKALTHPDALATQQDDGYEPFVKTGVDSKYFNHDLLHIIGIETDNLPYLYDHYKSQGNHEAACLLASMIESNQKIEVLDSLIDVYADLPVCGTLAVKRFGLMPNGTNADRKACYDYLQQSIKRWGDWKEMNQMRNRLKGMESSLIKADLTYYTSPSQTPQTFQLSYRNLQSATMTITRTTLQGDNKLVDDSEVIDADDVKPYLVPSSTQTIQHPFATHPIYEINNDSIVIPALDKGIYFITLTTDQAEIDTMQFLYCVTDLYVLHQAQPNDQWRYVVVNATTGKPVKGAKLCFTKNSYNSKKNTAKQTFTTDAKGEIIIDNTKGNVGDELYVYTNDDKAYPMSWHRNSFSLNKQSDKMRSYARIYTDRNVYRPGQTVYANVLAWTVDKGINAEVLTQKELTLTLRDANRRVVAERKLTLDDNGTCTTSFALPSSGLTGNFSLSATGAASSYHTIKVEEYKRPTFEVTLDDYDGKYNVGDTITLRGKATTYAGLPVQNAKVSYTVTRRPRWWFWYRTQSSRETEIVSATTSTNEQGEYMVNVPLVLEEKDQNGFFVFEVAATITDLGGESHEASQSLPIGCKPSVLLCNLPSRMEVSQPHSLRFSYLNVAGKEIPGDVRYAIFKSKDQLSDAQMVQSLTQTIAANKTTTVPTLTSGQYTLMAICGNDTIKQSFVMFSLKDKSPVIHTHDWFYQSADTFPSDNKPVYIQVGSSDKDQHFVYSIVSEGKLIENGTFDLSNGLNLHRFTYKEAYGTGLVINYAWVRNGIVYTHSAKIARPMPDKRLVLEWKSFRNRLTPGQNEEWTLTIKRPNGKAANAQFMATMYDKSLDQISEMTWDDDLYLTNNMPSLRWLGIGHGGYKQYYNTAYNALKVDNIELSAFNTDYYNSLLYSYNRHHIMYKLDAAPMAMASRANNVNEPVVLNEVVTIAEGASQNQANASDSAVEPSADQKAADNQSEAHGRTQAQVRENLNETAFFYPQLHTDSTGCVNVTFKLPESLTTWRFMGLAHDHSMNHGMITEDIVAQKQVMITPNMPRFIRKEDKAVITARLFNATDKIVQGNAQLELLDPLTDKVVYSSTQAFTIDGAGSTSASFALDNQAYADECNMLIARFTASGDGYSDGEQHYLPILSNVERVTTTVPFTQTAVGTKTINLDTLFPKKNVSSKSLTIEYTNNPSWLMIQALPYVADANDHNAISLSTAYYANRLAKYIVDSTPKLKETFQQWLQEQGNETSLMSSLEKNQDLKSVVLEETPWVIDAQNEQEQKRAIAQFFNDNQLNNTMSSTLQKLQQLQNNDGSFSWWKGMKGSLYMTVAVTKTLTRLNTLIGNDKEISKVINRAFKYLDSEVAQRVADLKSLEKKGNKHLRPSDALCDYLYANALAGRSTTEDIRYLIGLLTKKAVDLTIYGKANTAIILQQYGETKKAKEYLESIKQYTVYKEGMGRYFDSRNALYSWFDYKIPTEVAAIEALKAITPNDTTTINEMQQWLLQAKHTQAWDTPINSVNAIWAFSNNGQVASLSDTNNKSASMTIDGKALDVKPSAGIGYVKVKADADDAHTLKIDKTSTGTSWGAVYAQYLQPSAEISDAQSGIAIKREVINDLNTNASLKVGDKVKVRLTITADRDYDFVQVVDKRAACLEPVNTTSGYGGGYYIAPKDNATYYYFDQMTKGKHVVETEYYIDREGQYQQGTCTAQCAYSPDFSGRTKGAVLNINK